jgi:hypothetical protein
MVRYASPPDPPIPDPDDDRSGQQFPDDVPPLDMRQFVVTAADLKALRASPITSFNPALGCYVCCCCGRRQLTSACDCQGGAS